MMSIVIVNFKYQHRNSNCFVFSFIFFDFLNFFKSSKKNPKKKNIQSRIKEARENRFCYSKQLKKKKEEREELGVEEESN